MKGIFSEKKEKGALEKKLKESVHNFKQRVKELNCLYEISKLFEKQNVSINEIIQGTIESAQVAMRFPSDLCIRVSFDEKEYKTQNFVETKWKISLYIKIEEEILVIEAYYIKDNSFSVEEIDLLSEIVYRLKSLISYKQAEQKLKESEKNYREAYNNAELYKDLFTHDINNILQNILSSTELCKMYMDRDTEINKLNEMLDIIKSQVRKGAILISNIRKLSEIEGSQVPIEPTEVLTLLQKSIDYVMKSYSKKIIKIQLESDFKKQYVQANILFEDICENILINAIKYNDNHIIEIEIRISKERKNNIDYVRFEFVDNGIGILNERKKTIFHREGKKMKSRGGGMGLGLSLVKKIIDSYNGYIWVEDKVKNDYKKGSKFIVLIPRVK